MNTSPFTLFRTITLIVVGLAWFPSVGLADINTGTAQLDQSVITMDDTAQLTVTTSGTNQEISPPEVPGLVFEQASYSNSVVVDNGAISSKLNIVYLVTPQHPGTFKIPSPIRGGPTLTLEVKPSEQRGSTPSGDDSSSAPDNSNPSSSTSSPTLNNIHLSQGGAAFIRLILPKTDLYVGETIPIEIQLGLRPGLVASLDDLPSLNGDSFELDKLTNKPAQTQILINNVPFTLLHWKSNLTAIKPGNFPINLTMPVTVRMRTNSPQTLHLPPGFEDSGFDDSFFQNFFGSVVQKQISLTSDSSTINVQGLPKDGQPADFNGAVGNFKVASELSADRANLGDPVTLRLKITGTGDFGRVNSKMMDSTPAWKSYRPNSKFNALDQTGYEGEKDFEQAIIPLQPGTQSIPALTFNYFNPETRRYETAQSTPLTIEVTGTANPSVASTPPSSPPIPSSTSTATTDVNQAPPLDELRPDHIDTMQTNSSLTPIGFQPWFIGSNCGLVLTIGLTWLFLTRWQKNKKDDLIQKRRQTSAAIQKSLEEMSAAAAAGDSSKFFMSARAAFQHKLSALWGLSPSSITVMDLDSHQLENSSEIRRVFTLADEAAYSSQSLNTTDFQQWTQRIQHDLEQLNKS